MSNKIDEISNLPNNWNGYGADKFTEKVITRSKFILSIIESIGIGFDIFPTGRNSIQFEFYNDRNEYLELEIFESEISGLMENKYMDSHETCEFGIYSDEEILPIIKKFIQDGKR